MNKKLCLNVFECIYGDLCDDINDYFEIMKKTQHNGILKSELNPAIRVLFITEENASMISLLKLEVLKIVKSS